jgi:hypothetical protein
MSWPPPQIQRHRKLDRPSLRRNRRDEPQRVRLLSSAILKFKSPPDDIDRFFDKLFSSRLSQTASVERLKSGTRKIP